MSEGTRFDLCYESMPWHKVDTVVFDIGNVLIRYAPDDFLLQLFPGDAEKQRHMLAMVYKGPYWPSFDRGTMTYEEAAKRLAAQGAYPEADYMHALTGWIALKTPIEEGFTTAQRCRRAGKRLLLLSNYPREGYAYLRERFADRFEPFAGGVISSACGLIKPEPAIYQRLIDTYALTPSRTLFIDDTLANVEAAMAMGIHGFHRHENGQMDRFFL